MNKNRKSKLMILHSLEKQIAPVMKVILLCVLNNFQK